MNDCISIVIPIYNGETTLLRCLCSVQAQTHQNLDVILVDDGSDDGSQMICQDFCNQDDRFHLLCPPHGGVSHARNIGITSAKGNYLMFLDSDDEVLPDMVERYLQTALSTNADVVIGGIDFLNGEEHKRVVPTAVVLNRREIAEKICQDNSGLFGYVPNKLYRLPLLRETEILFDEKTYCQEDLDFALRIYGIANSFALLDYSGYLYYQESGKRTIDQNSLMKNRISIYRLACNAYVNTEITLQYASYIKNSLVKVLIRLRKRQSIQKISTVQGLSEVLVIHTKETAFVKLLVALFVHNQFGIILFFTTMRRALRKLLKR